MSFSTLPLSAATSSSRTDSSTTGSWTMDTRWARVHILLIKVRVIIHHNVWNLDPIVLSSQFCWSENLFALWNCFYLKTFFFIYKPIWLVIQKLYCVRALSLSACIQRLGEAALTAQAWVPRCTLEPWDVLLHAMLGCTREIYVDCNWIISSKLRSGENTACAVCVG